MYQAPEVEHLQRAVDAIKRGLLPEKEREPTQEDVRQEKTADEREDEEK